jgi:catalase
MADGWRFARKDFVNDAHAHGKFIGYVPAAAAIFAATGLAELMDDGYIDLSGRSSARQFVQTCRTLRFWPRLTAG